MSGIDGPRPMGGSAVSSATSATATQARDMGPSPRGAGDDTMCAVLAGNWWAVGLRGVFAILSALIAFSAPTSAILSLVLLFSAYMLVDGVAGIISAVRAAKRDERWGLLLLEG